MAWVVEFSVGRTALAAGWLGSDPSSAVYMTCNPVADSVTPLRLTFLEIW